MFSTSHIQILSYIPSVIVSLDTCLCLDSILVSWSWSWSWRSWSRHQDSSDSYLSVINRVPTCSVGVKARRSPLSGGR